MPAEADQIEAEERGACMTSDDDQQHKAEGRCQAVSIGGATYLFSAIISSNAKSAEACPLYAPVACHGAHVICAPPACGEEPSTQGLVTWALLKSTTYQPRYRSATKLYLALVFSDRSQNSLPSAKARSVAAVEMP